MGKCKKKCCTVEGPTGPAGPRGPAGTGGSGLSVTWRPDYVGTETGIYPTFLQAYAALQTSTATRTLIFDPSLSVSFPQFIIPPGAYDMTNVTWYVSRQFVINFSLATYAAIEISDGATFTNLLLFNGPMLVGYFGTTGPCVTVTCNTGVLPSSMSSVSIENGTVLTSTNGSPMYLFTTPAPTGQATISIDEGRILNTSNSPVISVDANSKIFINILNNSEIDNDTIIGAGSITIVLESHATFNGTPNQIPFSAANFPGVTGFINLADITGSPKTVVVSGAPAGSPYDSVGGFNSGDIYLDSTGNAGAGTFYMFNGTTNSWIQIS
jgi:hypothetical protein